MIKIFLAAAGLALTTAVFAQADSAALYLQKGIQEKAGGRRMESLKQFEKAYSFSSNNKDVVRELAAAYLDLRRYGQAREKFKQLASLGDQSDSTYRQLMLLSFNLRKFDEAVQYAALLKKSNPSEKTAYYVGKAYYEQEDLGNAIKHLELAAKEDPSNADIPYTIARAYADMQNFKPAIAYYKKAVELNPTNSRWLYELSLVCYGMNDDQNSLKYMLEAGEKGYKKDNEYTQNLATAYLNAGKSKEGIEALQALLKRRPTDKALLFSLAEAFYNIKNYDAALNYYDDVLKVDKQSAEALYMIGMCFQKKGEKQKGMALCDKAIEMDPSLAGLKQKKEMPGF